jgi:hypothetical protein
MTSHKAFHPAYNDKSPGVASPTRFMICARCCQRIDRSRSVNLIGVDRFPGLYRKAAFD